MIKRIKLSNTDVAQLKNKIALHHKSKIQKLLLVDQDMKEIEDLYKDFLIKKNELIAKLKKTEGFVNEMNAQDYILQKELKEEFGFEYSPKSWANITPYSSLRNLLEFSFHAESKFYNFMDKIDVYIDFQIKKNQEKLTSSQPQLIKKVEI